MKKVCIVLALLLVAALVFGGVEWNQAKNLQNSLKTAQDEAKSIQGQLDAKVKELETAQADLTTRTQELTDNTTALETAKAEMEKQAADLQAQLTAELEEKTKQALEPVAQELENAKAELDQAKADLETVKNELEQAKAESEQLKADLATAQEELAEKTRALEENTSVLDTVKAELEQAKADLEAKIQEFTENSTAMDTVKAELENAKNELEQNVSALTSKAAAAADQIKLLTANYQGKTVILHSNDVHGKLDGYAYIAGLRNVLERAGANVVLVDAGDFSQGTIYVSVNKGAAGVDMMNTAGYDIVTLGNHEFDYGYAQLMENLQNAKFQAICANVLLRENGESILPGHCIYDNGAVKIGFFGLETPETATKVNPGLIQEIDFTTFDRLYENAQAQVDALKEEGADLVVGLWHLGVDAESAANGYRSVDVLAKVNGVDFVIDGHSHTVMTQGENGEPIQSTGTQFEYIGVVVIDNETKTIEKNTLVKTEGLPKDSTTEEAAKSIMEAIDAEYSSPFATSTVDFNGDRAPGNRTQETNLGDLITDAMVWCVVDGGSIEEADLKKVVGITNGGGIRAALAAGNISMKDINTVLPFGNTVAMIRVTGNELLEALEASTFCTPDAIGGFPQTSGIVWTLDTTKPYDKGDLYVVNGKESTYYGPKSIQRVSIESVNGEPFDPEAEYIVVTNNFCAAGGDTYAVFYRAYEAGNGFDTSIAMDVALVDYIRAQLNSAITAEPQGGRLTIK